MNGRAVAHFLLLSLPAAAFGSVAGTLVLAGWQSLLCANCAFPPRVELGPVLGAMLLSLVGTYPGALLLGTPVAYPLRYRIAARPWALAVPMMAIGIAVGTAVVTAATWGAGRAEVPETTFFWPYFAATALGFVLAIRFRARRGPIDPA